ncbi:MAG: TetR/AcrR family transcriptional regulator [Alphaproteobacteria bacterium]|nr:TetR/AcrR family transcriptional regulator [Alphaproteobacteria bacterium]
MATSDRREHLIDTAIRLFAAHGYHATGIDTILKEAGVSKKTLYRHFRSKEELILSALRKYDGQFRNGFMREVEAAADTPFDRLLAVFDVAQDWFQQNAFYGCMFINAVGEYAAPDTPIRQACKDFKKMMRGYIAGLCRELAVQNPEALADEIAMLLEGAIVTAQVSQSRVHAAQVAKAAAKTLIDQATGETAGPA